MSDVYANGRTISAKKDGNKSIAAMADVCLSPPTPPAGPIPIPYPNFSEASDTSDGTKTVKISGEEVGKKNSSNYKTSKGDEAATKTLGMGVVTHQIQGKTYHSAWSMDVKVEDENVIRHLDLTTHNHASQPFNLAATVDVEKMAPGGSEEDCAELNKMNEEVREDLSKAKRGRRKHKGKRKVANENTTITHGKFKCPGGKTAGLAACSRTVATKYDNRFVKGLGSGSPQKVNRNTAICQEAKEERKFRYRATKPGDRPHTSHTESRIIEHVMGSARAQGASVKGCSLLMAIDWNSDPPSDEACPHCQRVICAAIHCGLKIKLCQKQKDGTSKPTEPDCSKNNLS
jgi:Domain of unknown function (DUF4150)